jgi:hypothetical protein
MDNLKAWTDEKIVDEVDELIADAFSASGFANSVQDQLQCYLLLAVLLRGLGQFSPGMNMSRITEQLRRYMGKEQLKEVEHIADQVSERVLQIVCPTYTAASYWSPIDRQRHTVSHRRALGANENEKHVFVYAYAFYALTFTGEKSGLYSATQFTAAHASRRRGVRVCYEEKPEDDPIGWWHIPRGKDGVNHERILNETRVTDAIKQRLLRSDVSTHDVKSQLRSMLINRGSTRWVDLNSFAMDFIEQFSGALPNLSKETCEDIERTKDYINRLFEADLDAKQTLFMLMTNLVYDQAFRSNYFYGFPVRIENLCSVMTVGMQRSLSPFEHSALTRIATSIFMHPLLLDYATQQSEATESKEKMLLMGGFAHSANNALRMADIDSLVSLLSSGEPPKDLRFAMDSSDSQDAIHHLRALWMGSRSAQAFIALAEMATRRGALREKFTSRRSYSLDECMSQAEKMIDVYLEGQMDRLPQILISRNRRYWLDVELPKYYLDDVYVYTLIYELLLNVCKYGERYLKDNHRWARAELSTTAEGSDVQIHVINRLSDQKKEWRSIKGVAFPKYTEEDEQSNNTFLRFASVMSGYIDGIKITSYIQKMKDIKYYHAILSLGSIPVEKIDSEKFRVSPVVRKM